MREDHEVAIRENSAFFARGNNNKKAIKENARKFDEIIKKQREKMLLKKHPSPTFTSKNIYDE